MDHQTNCPGCTTANRWSDETPAKDRKCAKCGRMLQPDSADEEARVYDDAKGAPVDSVLMLTCQLCRSQVMVDPAKIGTSVTCPDCHTQIKVVAPADDSGKKRFWSRNKDHGLPSMMGPDDEFKLSDPVNRPKIDYSVDPTWGLDDVAEDLLSAPLDPEVVEAEAVGQEEPDDADTQTADRAPPAAASRSKTTTRRGEYDQIQQRLLKSDRKEMRRQALKDARQRDKAKGRSKGRSKSRSKGRSRFGLGGKFSRKQQQRDRSGGEPARGLAAAIVKSFSPALLAGWMAGSAFWAAGYATSKQFGSASIIDRLLDPNLDGVPWREISAVVLVAIGSMIVWWQCGKVFRESFEYPPPGSSQRLSGQFIGDIVLFGFPWLVTGLPFLYLGSWSIPIQFFLLPFLLGSSWLNQSRWQVAAPLDRGDGPSWRPVFQSVSVLAAMSILPSALLHAGGLWAIPGSVLLVFLVTTLSIVCGWHCRRLAKTIEPAA